MSEFPTIPQITTIPLRGNAATFHSDAAAALEQQRDAVAAIGELSEALNARVDDLNAIGDAAVNASAAAGSAALASASAVEAEGHATSAQESSEAAATSAGEAATSAEAAALSATEISEALGSIATDGVLLVESSGGFWSDDATPGKMHKIADRVQIGKTSFSGNWTGTDSPIGNLLRWTAREATAIITSPVGRTAVSGLSMSYDQADVNPGPDSSGVTCIGVLGVGIANKDLAGADAWGGYFEALRSAGVTTAAFGVEIDAGNNGADYTNSPYDMFGSGVFGLNIAAGGSKSDGYVSPSTAAVLIASNPYPYTVQKWNKGIVFGATAITGTNGVTGNGTAVCLAKGHDIDWQAADDAVSTRIRSDVTASAHKQELRFTDNGAFFYGPDATLFAAMNVASSVNYLRVYPAATGSAPGLQVEGTDTNADLRLLPKGSGVVRFGGWTASSDVAVNGYITIKDSAGNSRKLATIA